MRCSAARHFRFSKLRRRRWTEHLNTCRLIIAFRTGRAWNSNRCSSASSNASRIHGSLPAQGSKLYSPTHLHCPEGPSTLINRKYLPKTIIVITRAQTNRCPAYFGYFGPLRGLWPGGQTSTQKPRRAETRHMKRPYSTFQLSSFYHTYHAS